MTSAVRYPQIQAFPDSLVVTFRPDAHMPARRVPIDVVVDRGADGRILGIEIISVRYHAGKKALDGIATSSRTHADTLPYVSYDDQADAMYIRAERGSSIHQAPLEGIFEIDSEEHLIRLEVILD